MIRKIVTLTSIFGITYGLYLFFIKNDKRPVEPEAQQSTAESENPYVSDNEGTRSSPMSSIRKSNVVDAQAKIKPQDGEDVKTRPPLLSTLREEIKLNPHTTPQSLVEYAQQIGKRMENAMTSSYNASLLFEELTECVESQDYQGSPSLQAFCISSAERLAQAHPEDLMMKYKEMLEKVPEDSAALMKAIDDMSPADE